MILEKYLKERGLPDLLGNADAKDWPVRRKELLAVLSAEVYGATPEFGAELYSFVEVKDEAAPASRQVTPASGQAAAGQAAKGQVVALAYSPDDVIGTWTPENVDEEVSQGTLARKGFFDLIGVGDEVILTPDPAAGAAGGAAASTAGGGELRSLLRALRY
jgi:hypothetical protein